MLSASWATLRAPVVPIRPRCGFVSATALCLHPGQGAWLSVRVIRELPLFKVPAFSFESITDSFFHFLFSLPL